MLCLELRKMAMCGNANCWEVNYCDVLMKRYMLTMKDASYDICI